MSRKFTSFLQGISPPRDVKEQKKRKRRKFLLEKDTSFLPNYPLKSFSWGISGEILSPLT